ncbi:hypothetical protein ABTC50_20550, partial [Acinetobacter baumannii]
APTPQRELKHHLFRRMLLGRHVLLVPPRAMTRDILGADPRGREFCSDLEPMIAFGRYIDHEWRKAVDLAARSSVGGRRKRTLRRFVL